MTDRQRDIFRYSVAGVVACVIILVLFLWKGRNDELPLEPTGNSILQIMPRNEMYVATAVIEDFTTRQQTEYHMGIFPEKHSCVQTLRQKVSYRIDLSKVKYEIEETTSQPGSNKPRTVLVTMVLPEYTASTIGSSFISDDEGYWKEAMPSNNDMKKQVERQIRELFDTQQNREKALIYAEEAISHILMQLGYQAEFSNGTLPSPQTHSF